jgi:hypothetical protein
MYNLDDDSFIPNPDNQDKYVNEFISCQPYKRNKYDHEIIFATKTTEIISIVLKAQQTISY